MKTVLLSEAEWKGVYQNTVKDLLDYDKQMMEKNNQPSAE